MRRKTRLGRIKVQAEEMPKKEAPKKEQKEYVQLAEPRELTIADGIKLIFSVSQTKDGRPHMDIRTHITSEKYTGPTKKGINFDIENLEDFIENLVVLDAELQKKGL